MDFGIAKILCVEHDGAVLESRCAILKHSGYDSTSTSPRVVEILLRGQRFDLIVLSRLNDSELQRITDLADGTDVLILQELTMPFELVSLVAERLNRQRRKA